MYFYRNIENNINVVFKGDEEMNFKKKLLVVFLILTFIFPIYVFAYSDKVILGGDNIGISVNTKEVLVVGFYKVNDSYIAKDAGFVIGDKITKVNGNQVTSINELVNEINKVENKENVEFTLLRNDVEKKVYLSLVKENDNYKTGLYIKDQITGVGTLTYIDPESMIFGSLGHEILDNSTGKIVNIKSGKIFEALVTGNIKSTNVSTGEKRAIFNQDKVYGIINKNTNKGIFGIYKDNVDNVSLIDVAGIDEIEIGPAQIYTVLNNNDVKSYKINIIKINDELTTKNILFEIVDEELLENTNGVIKGMSGSPIVQNNKIIGAVTHAIVNDNTKGYGIFITTMLEEGERGS